MRVTRTKLTTPMAAAILVDSSSDAGVWEGVMGLGSVVSLAVVCISEEDVSRVADGTKIEVFVVVTTPRLEVDVGVILTTGKLVEVKSGKIEESESPDPIKSVSVGNIIKSVSVIVGVTDSVAEIIDGSCKVPLVEVSVVV